MTLKSVLILIVLSIITFCGAANPENCPRCKLLPAGDGFASEFRRKASEKGVRLVYLNLKIDDSYHPLDLQDEFLPDLWVYANSISEPMLSLPNDYDILSLGLLNYQVRSMDVHLKDQPSGCLASLNSSCQNLAIGRVLLENVTMESSGKLTHKTPVACVAMIESHWHNSTMITLHDGDMIEVPGHYTFTSEYHCCVMHKLNSHGSNFIQCDQTVEKSNWLNVITGIVITISLFVAFYIPAFPLVLPNCVFSLQYECNKEDRANRKPGYSKISDNDQGPMERRSTEIPTDTHHMKNRDMQPPGECKEEEEEEETEVPIDDASPFLFSTLLLGYINKRLPFNIKLAFLLLVVYPFPLYFQLVIYHTLKKKYIDESIRKDIPIQEVISSLSSVASGLGFISGLLVVLVLMSLVPVLFLRPRDFLLANEITEECPLCHLGKELEKEFKLNIPRENLPGLSVADEIRHHLKILLQLLFFAMSVIFETCFIGILDKMLKFCTCQQWPIINHEISRKRQALLILWLLVFILLTLPVVLLYGVCCLISFLFLSAFLIVFLSPTTSLLFAPAFSNTFVTGSTLSIMLIVLWVIYNLFFWLLNFFALSLSCSFIAVTLVFVIVGLLLNYSIVTPYVVFVLVVTTNIYLCYATLKKKYVEVKKMILKWQKEIYTNSSVPEDRVPTKLFRFVCDRALPIKHEYCLMLRNMVLILMFLFFVVYSFVVFGNEYNVSVLFSTIAVFVSGVIPVLVQLLGLLKKEVFIGWEKITINREIATAVREFNHARTRRNSINVESSSPNDAGFGCNNSNVTIP